MVHMESAHSYFYVGSPEIRARVDEQYEGQRITAPSDVREWVSKTRQTIIGEELTVTFIISEERQLIISDRHSEHVVCAGGRNVLSAGEMTFCFDRGEELSVSELSNQSTGYCPQPSSWQVVEAVLDQLGIAHPGRFTRAFEFRYCYRCDTRNLIKENIFECAVCGADLPLTWNFDQLRDHS